MGLHGTPWDSMGLHGTGMDMDNYIDHKTSLNVPLALPVWVPWIWRPVGYTVVQPGDPDGRSTW